MQLTPEQQKLVETSEKTLRKIAQSFTNGTGHDFEEMFSAAQIALCKAALKYDPSKGEWKAFRDAVVCNALRSEAKKLSKLHEREWLGPFEERKDGNHGLSTRTHFPKRFGVEDDGFAVVDFLDHVESLTPFDKAVMSMYLEGLEQEEIAEKVHACRRDVQDAIYRCVGGRSKSAVGKLRDRRLEK